MNGLKFGIVLGFRLSIMKEVAVGTLDERSATKYAKHATNIFIK